MTDYCECTELAKDDLEPNLLRVGWSLNYSPLQLGESKFSFGYASNGKKCVDKTFEDYGDSFEKGDSIAAYLVGFAIFIIFKYEIFFSNYEIKHF